MSKRLFSLGPRLAAVGSFVRRDSRLLDVGTDHALLPIYLVMNGLCRSALCTDISESPLSAARSNVIKWGVSDKIELRLSDGFDNVSSGEFDDVTISGLGGEQISELLGRAPQTRNESVRLILQPQTRIADLRFFLCSNCYRIDSEAAVTDGAFDYCVISASYDGVSRESDDFFVNFGFLPDLRCDSAKRLIRKQTSLLRARLNGLLISEPDSQHIDEIRSLLERIDI